MTAGPRRACNSCSRCARREERPHSHCGGTHRDEIHPTAALCWHWTVRAAAAPTANRQATSPSGILLVLRSLSAVRAKSPSQHPHKKIRKSLPPSPIVSPLASYSYDRISRFASPARGIPFPDERLPAARKFLPVLLLHFRNAGAGRQMKRMGIRIQYIAFPAAPVSSSGSSCPGSPASRLSPVS